MKAILKFDLSNPEDNSDHYRCVCSSDMANALFEISRNMLRHPVDVEQIRDRLEDILEGLDVDRLNS